ncbi:peptidylprolyl isomerase [Geminicoccus roseus]|uniref:peptidylprolyl isomerase n=1 Tax=Geminicoccus roseus TaxID=404900 RepID=UPI0004165A93|nr:peptidylprolyl isomerase [Geminicoccus roseus]
MSTCTIKTQPAAHRAVVKVNGVVIPHAMISREAQNHPARSPAAAWKSAALALVVREALSQEVRRLDIAAAPLTDGQGRRETLDEARMRGLVEREVATPEPTEEECRRYYARNPGRFRTPSICAAAHILFAAAPGDGRARAEARDKARQAIAALAAEPGGFAELARLHSACPSREIGGQLGQVTRGQTVPEFEAALERMNEGELSREPVESRFGFHVIRLDRKVEGAALPFEIVAVRIAGYLADAVNRRAQAQYVARLLAAARVEGIEIPAPGDHNVH